MVIVKELTLYYDRLTESFKESGAVKVRKTINKTMILNEAWKLIADGGLNAISMRKLADKVNVKVSTLYWHFPNKESLLGTMTDQVIENAISNFPEEDQEGLWQDTLLESGLALAHAIRERPYAAELLISLPPHSETLFVMGDRLLSIIDGLKLSDKEKFYAISIFQNNIIAFERDYLVQNSAQPQEHNLSFTKLPYLNRLYDEGLFNTMGTDEMLVWSLNTIIAGISAQLNN